MVLSSVYSWLTTTPRSEVYEPSPHLQKQSIVLDERTGLRGSVQQPIGEEFRGLKVNRDLFSHALAKYGKQPCFGRRSTFDSPAEWITYEQVDENIRAVGSGLTKLLPEDPAADPKMIGVCGVNSPEWVYTQQACGAYSMVCVPLYNTLGEEALVHIVKQTQLTVVVCDTTKQAKWFMQAGHDRLLYVFVIAPTEDLKETGESCACNTKLMTFRELIEIGKANIIPTMVSEETDLCYICYTSGSSGKPKGVTFTHGQYAQAMKNVIYPFLCYGIDLSCIRHLSYLPLSHIMELVVLCGVILLGGSVAFLTKDVNGLMADLKFYKPNVLITVPRILMRIHNQFMSAIGDSSMHKYILNKLMDEKVEEQKRGIFKEGGLFNYIYFKKLRKKCGGQIKCIVTGSAPLDRQTDRFIRTAFCCPVIEGYGSTEVGCVLSVTLMDDTSGETAGALIPNTRVLLIDVPEMDICVERDGIGEICVSSDACTSGYYNDEENTKELFHENGFLRTGDIGYWTEFGQLKIVDRRKSMFKLCQGEYVAPGKLEQVYSLSKLVSQIFVDGDPQEAFPVAIVVPEMKELRHRCFEGADGEGIAGLPESSCSNEELCAHPVVSQIVVSDLKQIGEQAKLKGFEQVKLVYLSPEPFTMKNKLLTTTMKVARAQVRKKYAETVKQLYAANK